MVMIIVAVPLTVFVSGSVTNISVPYLISGHRDPGVRVLAPSTFRMQRQRCKNQGLTNPPAKVTQSIGGATLTSMQKTLYTLKARAEVDVLPGWE